MIPQQLPSDSDESSDPDSDIELLPDLHTTNIQPNDNDSSAYEQEDDESLEEEDRSSLAMSQSQHKRQIKLIKNRRTPGKQKGLRNRSNLSTKKSSKSANPKSAGNVINFYPSREEADVFIDPEVIKHRWKPLVRIPALTI